MDEANKLEIHEKHFVRPRLTRCYDSYFHYVCTNITKRYTILQVLPETVVRNTVFRGTLSYLRVKVKRFSAGGLESFSVVKS